MGVRTTSKHAAPSNGPTPWMDGHLDRFFNTEFNKGDIGYEKQPFSGMEASGGIINDYPVGADIYLSLIHI